MTRQPDTIPAVVLVDTVVFLNVLDVPGFNQKRREVMCLLDGLIAEPRTSLLLPVPAILETGNHIAQLTDGRQRRKYAALFATQVRQAFAGEAPWTPTGMPEIAEFTLWLKDFPAMAMREIGFGDLWIIKEWEAICRRHPRHRIRIWSLDEHLAGYDRLP